MQFERDLASFQPLDDKARVVSVTPRSVLELRETGWVQWLSSAPPADIAELPQYQWLKLKVRDAALMIWDGNVFDLAGNGAEVFKNTTVVNCPHQIWFAEGTSALWMESENGPFHEYFRAYGQPMDPIRYCVPSLMTFPYFDAQHHRESLGLLLAFISEAGELDFRMTCKPLCDELSAEIYARVRFMETKLAAITEHHPENRISKHWAKRNVEIPTIKTISLRVYDRKPHHGESITKIDWSHRWVVRPHWRQQYLPSKQRHEPRFIEAHIKGPSDKPVISKQSVFLVNR